MLLGLLARRLSHPQHAVDLPTLLDEQPPRRDVAMDDARRLELDAFSPLHTTAHFSTDDRFTRDDVTLDLAPFCHQHLATGADRPDDHPFHLHHAFRRDVAHHPHSRADDRESRLGALSPTAWLLREHRHVSSPPSRA